jgi:NAD(P)H-flavin reductase/hemoglobin-like flavoprotein
VTSHPSGSKGTPAPATLPFFLNEAVSDAAMTYFYAHLFAGDSEISAMFPAAMHAQRQRFYRVLRQIVALTAPAPAGSDPAAATELTGYLSALGRAHRKFGVRKEHYAAFRTALRTTADKFAFATSQGATGPDSAVDWEVAFDQAVEIMIGAAEEDAEHVPAWWTAEVTGHELRTPGIAVLTVQPSEPFPYRPGQHLTVQTPRWPRVWRRYSIANAPRDDGSVTLHVRAVGGGLVSNTLVHHTQPGDILLLGRSEGVMTPDTGSGRRRPVLGLAGGTGLAPLKAVAEALGGSGEPPEVVLYVGARSASELYDLPALRQMEIDSPWLEVIAATSQEMAEGTRHGTIPALARKARWQDRDVYVSGPDAMIVKTVQVLRDAGAPASLLHFDLPDYEMPADIV